VNPQSKNPFALLANVFVKKKKKSKSLWYGVAALKENHIWTTILHPKIKHY
jgi:hypothetical protein